MSASFERAWAFISKVDRDASLTDGYDDRTGLYYSYDSNVSQSQRIQVGDLAVIREDDYIAGWGIIEQIEVTPNQPKRMVRCPQCKRNRITRRKSKVPANRCTNCKREFEDSEAIVAIEYVTSFQAWYASTWTEAARPVDYRELEPLQIHYGTFNSMRPLNVELIVPLLDRISGRDLDLDLEMPPRSELSWVE
jgi:ribosomal protein L37AE/L43A